MILIPEGIFTTLVYLALVITAAAAIVLVVLFIIDARQQNIW